MTEERAALNTDRDLWREPPGDYYANRIFLTEAGGIGLDVGGHCIVKTIAAWFKLAPEAAVIRSPKSGAAAAPSPEKALPEQPIHRQNCAVFQDEPCNCGLEWKVPVTPRVATAGGGDWWLIRYDDADITPEVITGEEIARQVFADRLLTWNCQLFKMVDDGIRKHHAGGQKG